MKFPVDNCRIQFPALRSRAAAKTPLFFDGPAGSQVPESVIAAITNYLSESNANHGGVFATGRRSDAMLAEAHRAAADLVGAADPDEIVFGANMTTLTFAFSRALARTWRRGDEIIVTALDHDANVTPWVLAARDAGATVRHAPIVAADCTLDLTQFRALFNERTRLVAVGCASNAVGTLNPVGEIARWAHAVGAQVFLDAVHYAPHGLIDVAAWDCDYLACSAYKFFGPHVGILWGRRNLLEPLPAYKVRPAPAELPGKWMTGTQNHEGIAGVLAAIDYLADLGRRIVPAAADRRAALAAAFRAIAAYERELSARFLAELTRLPNYRLWGIGDAARLADRAPTFALTHARLSPVELATRLDQREIYTWHGNFYALPLTEALGLEPEGLLRIGFLHYNTVAEVDALLAALAGMDADEPLR